MEEIKDGVPDEQQVLELGIMLGQRRAFGMVAGRCSAAQAECLRKVRDEKTYLILAREPDCNSAGRRGRRDCLRPAGASRRESSRVDHEDDCGKHHANDGRGRSIVGAMVRGEAPVEVLTQQVYLETAAAVELAAASPTPNRASQIGTLP